ncbi:hypothetical protein BW737_003065 [Actinomyces ruminis]|uniref:Uncharacterized protein n=1 Tax=Actinomyces ruminis TaxID=1937003 RepID=A0ABX4MDE2_9ACTO|nr:hypothetical protein BW737_003065 [Actinomyces ruminis]
MSSSVCRRVELDSRCTSTVTSWSRVDTMRTGSSAEDEIRLMVLDGAAARPSVTASPRARDWVIMVVQADSSARQDAEAARATTSVDMPRARSGSSRIEATESRWSAVARAADRVIAVTSP